MYNFTPYLPREDTLDTVYVGMALVGCLGLAIGFLLALAIIETQRKVQECLAKLFPPTHFGANNQPNNIQE